MTSTTDTALKHFGVKGMKWGVRRSEKSGGSEGSSKKKKKIAAAAAVVGVAAIAVGAYYVSRKMNTNVPLKSAKAASSVKKGADAVKKVKMDKQLSDFIADSARRQASDQKGWSAAMNKSLGVIAKEDKAFMDNYILNWTPKAIGR